MDDFEEFIGDITGRQTLIAATLSDVRDKRGDGVTKVQARPVEIRVARVYQFAYFSGTLLALHFGMSSSTVQRLRVTESTLKTPNTPAAI